MRKIRTAVLAGVAAVAAIGTALAASHGGLIMKVGLPDGAVARIEYEGDVAPKVTVTPASSVPPITWLDPFEAAAFAAFDRIAADMIAGPGSLSAAVLVMGRTENWIEGGSVLAMIMVCMLSTWLAMLAADRLVLLLGSTGADVVGRISGVLLAGLAVQFVFDGLAAAPFLAG